LSSFFDTQCARPRRQHPVSSFEGGGSEAAADGKVLCDREKKPDGCEEGKDAQYEESICSALINPKDPDHKWQKIVQIPDGKEGKEENTIDNVYSFKVKCEGKEPKVEVQTNAMGGEFKALNVEGKGGWKKLADGTPPNKNDPTGQFPYEYDLGKVKLTGEDKGKLQDMERRKKHELFTNHPQDYYFHKMFDPLLSNHPNNTHLFLRFTRIDPSTLTDEQKADHKDGEFVDKPGLGASEGAEGKQFPDGIKWLDNPACAIQ